MVYLLVYVACCFGCFVIGGLAGMGYQGIRRGFCPMYYVFDLRNYCVWGSYPDLRDATKFANEKFSSTGNPQAVARIEAYVNEPCCG
jgi:hypothetical protein